eukprot:jgi/Chlat1/8384/Chrsp80S07824
MPPNERTPLLQSEQHTHEPRTPRVRTPRRSRDQSKSKTPATGDEESGLEKEQNIGLLRVLREAREERPILFLATIMLMIAAFANMALPQFAGRVLDAITSVDKDYAMSQVRHSVLYILICVAVGSVASALRAYLFSSASERVVARMRMRLFNALMTQEVGFFDVSRTGELLNRLSEDTSVLKSAATSNLSMALRSAATAIIGLAYMFVTSWKLSCVTVAIVPITSVAIRYYGRYVKRLSKQTQAATAAAATVAEESLGAVRTVRSFARERTECFRYGEKVLESRSLGLRAAVANGLFTGGMFAVAMLSMVIVLWYGAILTIRGELSTGTLSSFILYTFTVGSAIGNLSGLYTTIMKALGASQRVFQLMDRDPRIPPSGKQKPMGHDVNGAEVRLEGVWFAYPSRAHNWVLKGVDLSLAPGQRVALVGHSGGGKSTVAALIQRFYDPQKGRVFIDNVPLPDIDHEHLHREIAMVSQEPVLFARTIRENIAYGKDNTTMEEIEHVARMANAHDFISGFSDGYNTAVGERGVRLSGGQKQRIAIARALLMNPRLLLLDEATSALDAESEFLVQDALERLMSGRTTLVIAHRLSTVKSADIVCVVDEGVIRERGTHEELLEQNGIYAALVRRQLTTGGFLGREADKPTDVSEVDEDGVEEDGGSDSEVDDDDVSVTTPTAELPVSDVGYGARAERLRTASQASLADV